MHHKGFKQYMYLILQVFDRSEKMTTLQMLFVQYLGHPQCYHCHPTSVQTMAKHFKKKLPGVPMLSRRHLPFSKLPTTLLLMFHLIFFSTRQIEMCLSGFSTSRLRELWTNSMRSTCNGYSTVIDRHANNHISNVF